MRRESAQIRAASQAVRREWPTARQTLAAVYVRPEAAQYVHLAGKRLAGGHYLEWNIYNSAHAPNLATDLDGILFAPYPWLLPRRQPVKAIVTARLERDRASTEALLRRYGVQYERLICGPWTSEAERDKGDEIARWKAARYLECGARLFVESEPEIARAICRFAKRPVLCPALERILRP